MGHAGFSMRDPEIIENELMEISAIADDSVKLERIIAWCALHPDEIPFALHQLLGGRDKQSRESSSPAASWWASIELTNTRIELHRSSQQHRSCR